MRVAIVNDYELVVVGVAALLEPYRDRVQVVELDSNLPVLRDVDVILYDTFGQVQGKGVDVDSLVDGGKAKVVIYSWNLHRELVQDSLEAGRRATSPRGWRPRSSSRRSSGSTPASGSSRAVAARPTRSRSPPGRARSTASPSARRRSSP